MPFLIFRGKAEHQKALDVIVRIHQANESLPLERRITGIISSFKGLDDNDYSQVYFFSWAFVYAFESARVRYGILNKDDIGKFLSCEGKEQYAYAEKTRPQHIIDYERPKRKEEVTG